MLFSLKDKSMIEGMNEQELEIYTRSLTKMAKPVFTKDDILYGKDAINKKFRGKVVNGDNNLYFLNFKKGRN